MIIADLFPKAQPNEVLCSVILPVKDEAEGLVATLDALNSQLDLIGNGLNKNYFEVLLLANNCTDNSFALAVAYQKKYPNFNLFVANINLPKATAHIGTVRRLLMDEAYRRFVLRGKLDGIIASTDGDSEVDEYWVQNIIVAMKKGIDVVGGRIIPRKTPVLSRLYHLQNVTYRYYVSQLDALLNPSDHDPWPRHFQCFGPSVAVTCNIYEQAGRLPAIPFLEDEEFRKALYRIDAKVRMCPNVKVYTSSRLEGKVDFGFSVQLQRWGEMKKNGEKICVDTLDSLSEIFRGKYQLRKGWNSPQSLQKLDCLNGVGKRLKLDVEWLNRELSKHRYFGTLWEKVEQKMAGDGKWDEAYPLAPIEDVITDMRRFFYGDRAPDKTFNNLRDTA